MAVLDALMEGRSLAQVVNPPKVDRHGKRHDGEGRFGGGPRDTTHARVLAAIDDAHSKVAAVDPDAAKHVKSARDIAARTDHDGWDTAAVFRNLHRAHEQVRHGVSADHEAAIAALGAANELHVEFRRNKRAEAPVGGLVAGPPPSIQEGVVTAVRKARDYVRGGDPENRGRFSHVPGPGKPATSGRGRTSRTAAAVTPSRPAPAPGRTSSKPGAPQRTSVDSRSRTPRSLIRPEGTTPKVTPTHQLPKLTEDELPEAVGKGSWSTRVLDSASKLHAGDVEDTEQLFRTKLPNGKLGPYPPERIDLHNRILRLLFQGAGYHKGEGEKREAIFMAGGPASGKSSLIRQGKVKLPDDAVDVNPDIVRTMLPEYDELVRRGDTGASSKTHEEASHIAKMAMNLAAARGHHVVVDGTGNSAPGKFRRKIEAMLGAGYTTRVIYATTDTEEAVKRANERGQKTGRYVPTGYVRSSHRDVSRRFVDDISAIPDVGVEVYETGGGGAHLVAAIAPGSTQPDIRDRTGFERFVDKAQLPKQTSYGEWLDRNFGGTEPKPLPSRA